MSEEMANKAVSTYRERYEAVGLFENRVYPGIRRLLRRLKRDEMCIRDSHNSLAHASASLSRWMPFSVMSRLTSSAGFAASTTMNRSGSVSYTHLDVYKRQHLSCASVTETQYQAAVKLYGVFPSSRG